MGSKYTLPVCRPRVRRHGKHGKHGKGDIYVKICRARVMCAHRRAPAKGDPSHASHTRANPRGSKATDGKGVRFLMLPAFPILPIIVRN